LRAPALKWWTMSCFGSARLKVGKPDGPRKNETWDGRMGGKRLRWRAKKCLTTCCWKGGRREAQMHGVGQKYTTKSLLHTTTHLFWSLGVVAERLEADEHDAVNISVPSSNSELRKKTWRNREPSVSDNRDDRLTTGHGQPAQLEPLLLGGSRTGCHRDKVPVEAERTLPIRHPQRNFYTPAENEQPSFQMASSIQRGEDGPDKKTP
jgi:hypothetical protein